MGGNECVSTYIESVLSNFTNEVSKCFDSFNCISKCMDERGVGRFYNTILDTDFITLRTADDEILMLRKLYCDLSENLNKNMETNFDL